MIEPARNRKLLWLAILLGGALVMAANAHLVWTSLNSQPDCVAHLKEPGTGGHFRAAQSSC